MLQKRNRSYFRIKDLHWRYRSRVDHPIPSDELITRVWQALVYAQNAACDAAKQFLESYNSDTEDIFAPPEDGFAYVVLSDPRSEVTQAFLYAEAANAYPDVGYYIHAATSGASTNSIIGAEEAAAKAAREELQKVFPNRYSVK